VAACPLRSAPSDKREDVDGSRAHRFSLNRYLDAEKLGRALLEHAISLGYTHADDDDEIYRAFARLAIMLEKANPQRESRPAQNVIAPVQSAEREARL